MRRRPKVFGRLVDTARMRARGLVLAFVFFASACSSSGDQIDSGEGARPLGEPTGAIDALLDDDADTTDRTSAIDDGSAPGVIAFNAETEGDPVDAETEGDPVDVETEGDPVDDASLEETNEAEPETELSLLTDELIEFVEAARGYTFETRPKIEILGDVAFGDSWQELVSEDAQKNRVDYTNYTDIYRAMGVIEGDRTLEEIWTRFGGAGVLGYYDPETGGIKLRAGELTTFTKTVLVHELVHALEDQIFGLERNEYDDRDDEIGWTFSALSEGSARYIESRYRETLSAAERDDELATRRALPRTVSLTEFTTSFLELQFGRYRYGESFVEALWNSGQHEIDAAFVDPPSTSELILDPTAYLGGQQPDGGVGAPPADGPTFESGVWGEAAWAAVLADTFDRGEALEFANGWGGDRFVAWRTGGLACVRIHVEADTPAELDEYAFALEGWARETNGREVFYPTADLVRVTACA
ncbi:MAG: hypothetical protein ACI81L_001069 [Verrucomicrobiales bacterium]|jgi:hypothetical protein